jgi:Fe(3+) dicitrate transport protein
MNITSLLGIKYYKAHNRNQQGPGSSGIGPNFNFQIDEFFDYPAQSNYTYPNLNTAIFGEQLMYIGDNLSVTPGFRFEYINTKSEGFSKRINLDQAGNVILNQTDYYDEKRERSFLLFGIGVSYKPINLIEFYANISQNYRSVTFADISIINPAYVINPDINDEKGYTADMGLRGNIKDLISYDFSLFYLNYDGRIGFIQKLFPDGNVRSERGNIGNANIFGLESLIDFNLSKLFNYNNNFKYNLFFNTSIIDSEYTASQANGVKGNRVEFVPRINFKSGFKLSYKKTYYIHTFQNNLLTQQMQ